MKHFTINLVAALVYAAAIVVLLLDMLVWRPG